MSPLQKIAMGLVIVIGNASIHPQGSPSWERYDLLVDPVGWVLVLLGTVALSRAEGAFSSLRWTAGLAGLVSVPMWFPQLSHRLPASGEWAVSLPQIAFCLLLAREIGLQAVRQQPADRWAAQRFGLLVTGFAVVAILPVVALGAGVDSLRAPTGLVAALVSLVLVYHLFRVHRRTWLGGPGPLEVPRRTPEGRPPSQ